MNTNTPHKQRESAYHRSKRIEKYWTIALTTLVTVGTLYFGLHIINYIGNLYV